MINTEVANEQEQKKQKNILLSLHGDIRSEFILNDEVSIKSLIDKLPIEDKTKYEILERVELGDWLITINGVKLMFENVNAPIPSSYFEQEEIEEDDFFFEDEVETETFLVDFSPRGKGG